MASLFFALRKNRKIVFYNGTIGFGGYDYLGIGGVAA